jgi:hypothetical protein
MVSKHTLWHPVKRLLALPTFVKIRGLTFAIMTVAVVPIPIVASWEDN